MYSEEDIKKLEPHEHIRLRPKLYFGGIDQTALHSAVDQVLDEFAREALAGNTNQIEITLLPDERICIKDNGSEISVKPVPNWDKTILEAIFTIHGQAHSGWSNCRYHILGGNHGLGVNCANAVSLWFEVQTEWDGSLWRMVCEKGVKQSDPERVRKLDAGEATGTTITFVPDFTVFEQNEFDLQVFTDRAQELAYLIPGLTMIVRDQRQEPHHEEKFYYADGLTDLIKHINGDASTLHPVFRANRTYSLGPVRYMAESSRIEIEFAFQYADTDEYHEHSYVNTVKTGPKSSHVAAFRDVFLDTINRYTKHRRTPRIEDGLFSWEEIAPGLTIAISVMHEDPEYADSGIRSEIENRDIYGLVASLVHETMTIALQDDPNLRDAINQKALSNRNRLSHADDRRLTTDD